MIIVSKPTPPWRPSALTLYASLLIMITRFAKASSLHIHWVGPFLYEDEICRDALGYLCHEVESQFNDPILLFLRSRSVTDEDPYRTSRGVGLSSTACSNPFVHVLVEYRNPQAGGLGSTCVKSLS